MTDHKNSAVVRIDPQLYKILKTKSAETSRSVSELINEAIRHHFVEEPAGARTFKNRVQEPVLSYERFLREMKQRRRTEV